MGFLNLTFPNKSSIRYLIQIVFFAEVSMDRRKLTVWYFGLLFFFIFVCPSPAISGKKEDTAHLLFQKTAVSKENVDTYIVKNDEWIFDIIRKRFGGSEKEILKMLKLVKRLNPEIKNFNTIRPGQKLLLPQSVIPRQTKLTHKKHSRKSFAKEKKRKASLSKEKKVPSK